MYERVLLTLDTSEVAERAIDHAVAISKAFGACLCIISVVPVHDRDEEDDAAVMRDWEGEVSNTEEYLQGVQTALAAQGIDAQLEIRRGDVAEEVLIFADKCDADMIIMATHGRANLGRWVYGSVADAVLRGADCPVLVVRVEEEPDEQD